MLLNFSAIYNPDAWLETARNKHKAVAEAAVGALRDVASDAVQEGQQDIAAAGKFTGGWVKGLQYRTKDATQGGEASLQAKAIIFHKIGLAGVFEYGATIHGKPLLWIPTERGGPSASKFGRGSLLGRKQLEFATINGTPVAFDPRDKDRHRKPVYIGVPQVTIQKKFHITEIVKDKVSRIALYFIQRFKDD